MRKSAIAAFIGFLAWGLLVISPASAGADTTAPKDPGVGIMHAAACNNNFVGGPNNSSGSLQAKSGAVWHKGPGGNYCTLTSRSGLAYVWCYTTSASGNFWYLARDNSSSQLGWIWAAYVTSTSGSIKHC
jgi:hypothetical protein